MPTLRAGNLAGQSEFITLDNSAHWLGDWVGNHYQPALHRTATGRWFAGFLTRDGYADLTGYPLRVGGETVYPRLVEATADGAARWFDANRIDLPDVLIADLQERTAPHAPVDQPTASPAAPDSDARPALPPGQPPVRRATRDTNSRVKELLEQNHEITSAAIAAEIKVAEQTVRRSRAWQEHQKRKKQSQPKPKATDAMDHARTLTAPMLAVRADSSAADPSDIAAEREEQGGPEAIEPTEVLRNRFFAEATPGMRARLNRLPAPEQEMELRKWELTGEFLPDDPPISAPLRQRIRRTE